MKTIIKTTIIIVIYAFCSCSSNEDITTNNDCSESEIALTEKEVIAPTTNTSYLVGLTFSSIRASTTKIEVTAIVNNTNAEAIFEIENFTNTIGSQQLNSNPFGQVKYIGETYTTYYQPNGQSSYVVEPKGEIIINDINQDCNTISGTIFIQAYTLSSTLGEIRFSAKFDFENIPLDNQEYQL